jgi:hypothetical protein
MPATQGVTGFSAKFFIGTVASPDSYNAVSEIKSIRKSDVSVPSVNYTHLNSPLNTEEIGPGFISPGTVEISGNFIGDTSQLSVLPLAQGGVVFFWKITAPCTVVNGVATKTYTATGACFVSKYSSGPWEINKPVEFQGTFQITGVTSEVVA